MFSYDDILIRKDVIRTIKMHQIGNLGLNQVPKISISLQVNILDPERCI
jgi:hypothetical protein